MRKKKLSPMLFDENAMILHFGQKAVNVLPLKDKWDIIRIFKDKFTNKVVTYNPNSKGHIVLWLPLRLDDFAWVASNMPPGNIFQFQGQLFCCGLLILPIYLYGAMQTSHFSP